MDLRTVDWTATRTPGTAAAGAEGLRERKKRLMRQQLSDTATQMFMERGFDAVRVTEIAEACGVSEKTVFNYFPTKESLILDRLESTMSSLKSGLADPGVLPTEAALRILDDELSAMTSWLAAQQDPAEAGAAIRRFGALIQDTPSLRAYQSDMMDQFTAVAAGILAGRAGVSPDDPEPQIAATALLGLWRVQFQALSRYLDGIRTPAQVHRAVTADVHRAARLISTGLNSFSAFTPAQRGAGQPLRLSRSGRIMRWCGAPRHQRPEIPGCIGIGGSEGMSPDVRGAAFSASTFVQHSKRQPCGINSTLGSRPRLTTCGAGRRRQVDGGGSGVGPSGRGPPVQDARFRLLERPPVTLFAFMMMPAQRRKITRAGETAVVPGIGVIQVAPGGGPGAAGGCALGAAGGH